jgi:hypothetical protein
MLVGRKSPRQTGRHPLDAAWHLPCWQSAWSSRSHSLLSGFFCALASRVLLVIAAVKVSGWWAFGVVLPLGPLLFRLKYPDLARSSMLFRFATLSCLLLYLAFGPGLSYRDHFRQKAEKKPATEGYALEANRTKDKPAKSSGPTVNVGADLEQRWLQTIANFGVCMPGVQR